MTQEEFIKILEEKKYSYEMEGDEILVTYQGHVWLDSLQRVPPGVQFKNQGYVSLDSLESLPPGVQFKNQGSVWLDSLERVPSGVRFENQGSVWLDSLESLSPGVQFQNQGGVRLDSLVGGWFNEWAGNIEGIEDKRLLNLMIDKELFL